MAKDKHSAAPVDLPQPSVLGASGPDIENQPTPGGIPTLNEEHIEPLAGDEQLWELEYGGNKTRIKVGCTKGHEKSDQPQVDARAKFNALLKRSPSTFQVKARCIAKGAGIASAVLDRKSLEIERAKRRGVMQSPEQELAILKARVAELEGTARKTA